MKIVATNIFDFNNWYRYSLKTISRDVIIDLSEENLQQQELYVKTGFFEEDGDVFFAELPENIENFKTYTLFNIPINSIRSVIPLNEKGAMLLANKMPDFKISEPLNKKIANSLIDARNKYLSINGGDVLLNAFRLNATELHKHYTDPFLHTMKKYTADLSADQDSILDKLVFYERARPYPNTDDGFLYDVGSIAKSHFALSDEDLRNKSKLKEDDIDRFELVEEIHSLSKFLQENKEKGVFKPFLQEYMQSEWLQKLDRDLSINPNVDNINTILVIAFYLKFRYLIRNTSNVADNQFYDEVKRFLNNVPLEASIALYLNGMFFGSLKFRELNYKYNPLTIAKLKYLQPVEPKKSEIKEGLHTADIMNDSEEQGSGIEIKKGENTVVTTIDGLEKKVEFDHLFLSALESKLPKEITKAQKNQIQKAFTKTFESSAKMFSDKQQYFLTVLEKEIKETKSKSEKVLKKKELIEFIQSVASEYFKN